MTGRPPSTAVIVGATAFALAVGVLRASERYEHAGAAGERVLYVRSGDLATRVALSFDALASDVYWMRAIQHYGRERGLPPDERRFPQLQPLLDIATTLDPRFNVVYRYGAIFLALDPPDGAGRPDQAIALLEKGLRANPARWQYAQDIGYVHYFHTRRFDEAARWFGRAAAMPGAPRWLGQLSAVTMAQGGDREGARRLLSEVASANDGYIRRSAERGLMQLQALDDLDRWQAAVRGVHERTGRLPATLSEVRAAFPALPASDPTGRPYVYDAVHGLVDVAPGAPIAPLPKAFDR